MTRAKLWMSFIGMGLALAGVATSNTLIVWLAIAVLGVAVVFRLLGRHRVRSPSSGGDEEPPAPGGG